MHKYSGKYLFDTDSPHGGFRVFHPAMAHIEPGTMSGILRVSAGRDGVVLACRDAGTVHAISEQLKAWDGTGKLYEAHAKDGGNVIIDWDTH